jgi:hypothetical protein
MRLSTLALAGLLALSVAFPAAAQRGYGYYHYYSAYEFCQRMAADNSLVPGQHGYTEFMKECTTGRVGTYTSPR